MEIKDAPVGARVWFAGESRPYRVQARDGRFLVCTKPFNPKKTVLYTVIDLAEGVRGTDGFVFGLGYEAKEDCEDALATIVEHGQGITRRNVVNLNVERIAA